MNEEPSRIRAEGPRIAVLGAFPFPYPQGSQIFVADQARALARAGAQPILLSYGRGLGERPRDLEYAPAPARLSPRAMRSGPNWGKPLADLALLASWRRTARQARRQGRAFDFVLAHNAEAATIALLSRRSTRTPVIYVAHTLLEHELSAYLPERHAAEANRAGRLIDRALARRVDGVMVLSEEAREALAPHARGPVAQIPPGFFPEPEPEPSSVEQTCSAHGLRPGHYVLYSGNLDRYQELELFAQAGKLLPGSAPPLVIATHDGGPGKEAAIPARDHGGGIRRVVVRDFGEMRKLLFGAFCLVAPRRRIGGFPIKLLNYMETRRPIVAFDGRAPGLAHDESAWLLDENRGAGGLAEGIAHLHADPARAKRLGSAARRRLETHHPWPGAAAATLDYLGRLGGSAGRFELEEERSGDSLSSPAEPPC